MDLENFETMFIPRYYEKHLTSVFEKMAPMIFSLIERAFMATEYASAGYNSEEGRRRFQVEFNKPPPSRSTIKKTYLNWIGLVEMYLLLGLLEAQI